MSESMSDKNQLSSYETKVAEEKAIFKDREIVHDKPEIQSYWIDTYILPMMKEAGCDGSTAVECLTSFFVNNLLQCAKRVGVLQQRYAALGSGNCNFEISIVQSLLDEGLDDFVLECIDINPDMLERGRELALKSNVADYMAFTCVDINAWRPNCRYEAVLACQSLHHFVELEHLFDVVREQLHPSGAFIICDIIGRNGHLRWPEALDMLHRFWRQLPKRYKYNMILKRHEELYENWDCSVEGFEGVRAQDILPLLLERFHCQSFVAFGNLIDVFTEVCFGHHYNPKNDFDRSFIERIHLTDEECFRKGKLTPTHMFGIWVKQEVENPFYSRGLTPEQCLRRP